MSEKELFLWEFLISKIKFEQITPQYEDIVLQLNCSDIVDIEIVAEECPIDTISDTKGEFDVKFGKTLLFYIKPDALLAIVSTNSLKIELLVSKKPIGNYSLKFPSIFTNYLTSYISKSKPDPAIHSAKIDLSDPAKKKVATIEMGIKLWCLGLNIETYFTIRNKEATFMNAATKMKFTCEKSVTIDKALPTYLPTSSDTKQSWMDEMDTISIKFNTTENPFLDMLTAINDESSTSVKKSKKKSHKGEDIELTSEKIMKKICHNPICPAAKKFKEYGLGPLATGPGLGTLYKKVEPHRTYRLSNTYGTFTRYGPFGVFAKSEYPFFPPKSDPSDACPYDFPCMPDESDEDLCACPDPSETSCSCRLRGGAETKEDIDNNVCLGGPLRLRGGGATDIEDEMNGTYEDYIEYTDINYDYEDFNYFSRLRGGGKNDKDKKKEEKPFMKSPMEECQPVMEEFNKILRAYKNALGPCGEASCPFSQNICEQYCSKTCKPKSAEPCPCVKKDSCQDMPCDIDDCPFKEKPKPKFPGCCGSTKCPYAQYKLGLVTDDVELELAYLPPPIIGKCGDLACDYPPAFMTLPPIHWDCPDPLPQGVCKNPNCPHQPKGLKDIVVKKPKAPCGSSACPYALPPPCDLHNCPFRQKPCPYIKQKEAGKNPTCKSSSSEEEEEEEDEGACCNPECPFSKKKKSNSRPPSRLKGGGSGGCSNPGCPQKKKNPSCCCNQDSDTEESFCDSPECPLNRDKMRDSTCPPPPRVELCRNPECPSRTILRHKKKDSDEDLVCDNKDCPYRKGQGNRDDDGVCTNPACPYNDVLEQKEEVCGNPNCPFAGIPPTGDAGDSGSVCSNPDCPFVESRKKKKGKGGKSVCENPCCPYKEKKPPQNLDICDACTDLICDNPDCKNFCPPKPKPGPDYCDNPMCPFSKEYQTSVCVDPFCPYGQPLPSCGIPNCPYERKPILFCPSPICPSKFPQSPPQRDAAPSMAPTVVEEKKRKVVDGAGDNAGENQTGGTNTAAVISTQTGKRKSRYEYEFGDKWPGVKIGHKECKPPRFRIPQKMGWMWKLQQPYYSCKLRRGWRPGCIEKTVAQIIRAYREAKGLGLLMIPDFGSGGGKRRRGTESSDSLHMRPKPTLHITKKDGVYNILMNPLKDPKTLAENEDPYIQCTPMQFKITKNKLKADDQYCHCNDPDEADSDDSELDIEFTPPAGIIHPDRFKKKKNVIHVDTQYNPADFAEKKKPAKKVDKKKEKQGKKEPKEKRKTKKWEDPGYC